MIMKVIIRMLLTKFFVILLLFVASDQAFGQTQCFSTEEAEKAVNLINAVKNVAVNEQLRSELLKMREAQQKAEKKVVDNQKDGQKTLAAITEIGEKNLLRLCEIIKQNGWTGKELVGEDGAAAALSIIKGNRSFKLQREIFPVVVAAAKKGYTDNSNVAWLIDSIRVSAGQTQIFGTQIKIRDEMFYLYPLENEAKVDEWRKLYNLPSLSDFIKYLQSNYQMIVLKSPRLQTAPKIQEKKAESSLNETNVNPLVDLEQEELVKVESNLVNLNVRVSAADPTVVDNISLQQNDFAVFEDGEKQEISFFSTADTPFDLILLLDLSGSTIDKQDLIRKSTRRFIEATRPTDRIAIVTFTDEAKIISDLTQNREELLKSVKKIDDSGGSAVWGSLQFVFDKIIKPKSQGRRSAILVMTDGVDSSLLPGFSGASSSLFSSPAKAAAYPTFNDLLQTVRSYDTLLVPIYLDTESRSWETTAYRTARKTLGMLAEETGGQVYHAKKVNDLNGIYEKIIADLGKVYSLGYQPLDDKGNGAWRSISVKIPNHPNLTVRTKQGYYSK